MRGSVRQRSKGTWRLTYDGPAGPETGRRRQLTRTVRGTKKAAQGELARLLVEAGHGEPARRTVGDLFARWFAATDGLLSPKTIEDRQRVWRLHLEPTFGRRPLAELTAERLDALYGRLRGAGYKPATILKVHSVARGACAQAVKWGWLPTNPVARATPPRQPKGEIVIPDATVVAAALAACDRWWPEFGVLVRLGAMTGLRRGELCALQWGDVDLDDGAVAVRRSVVGVKGRLVVKETKTGHPRRLALGPAGVAMLRAHRTATGERLLSLGRALDATTWLFPGSVDGARPTHPSTVSHRWLRVCRSLGIAIRLHDLRHHSASQLVGAGTNLRTVMERHGWTSLATAQRYVHVIEERDREAAEVLERVLESR